ncbi:tryptophan--tRNA ligase, mitochondrial-like [Rhopilema esculentum]|uniref:tryptophan--tRNA ligase, mitochondrial-like n=1 Tax=Rhopilema esculentum TaxID=499914 RepID=UPI0031D77166|eukprot:gene17284-8851_t
MNTCRRIFSGIQPTGVPHIGNYYGAIKNWVKLQSKSDQVIFSIVDMHALTIPKDPEGLRITIEQTAISLLAAGIDPVKCILFQQSQVPEHLELSWILSCLTSTGQLNRMHQWKTKAAAQKEKSSLGLLSYPVLMAADVLLYKTTHVPVGEDQIQHLELARDLARLFNNRYGHIFPEPVPILANTCRVMNLQDPSKKMSKSETNNRGRIDLTDTQEEINNKIKKAVTDSILHLTYEPKERAGIANLISIFSSITGDSPDKIVQKYSDKQPFTKYLKSDLADYLTEDLESFRKEFQRLGNDRGYVRSVLDDGWKRARSIATENIKDIKECLGLNIK